MSKIILLITLHLIVVGWIKANTTDQNNVSYDIVDTVFVSAKDDLEKVLNNPNHKIVSLKNDGVYLIDKTIEIKSNITLIGNGSIIKPILQWDKFNDEDSPLISLVGIKDVEIRDVFFDF